MRITWYGHAAFLLESDETGVRVALDPYRAPDVGTYAPIDDWADLVAVSHDNPRYHSYAAALQGRPGSGDPTVVDGLRILTAEQPAIYENIPFTAVRVYENERRDEDISMVGLTLDGLRVLHMGDCGLPLTPEDVEACGHVDILLALAGGPPTLTLPNLVAFVEALRPAIVIPMHFGNDKINLNLHPVQDFLALQPDDRMIRQFDSPTIEIRRELIPAETEVWTLPPAR